MARNVLIVEDDPSHSYVFERTVRSAGFEPLTALTAESAKELLSNDLLETPSAVILDLGLPGMSGEVFLEALRRMPEWKEVPVIVVTGKKSPGDALRATANAVLIKPIDVTQLTGELQRLLSEIEP